MECLQVNELKSITNLNIQNLNEWMLKKSSKNKDLESTDKKQQHEQRK